MRKIFFKNQFKDIDFELLKSIANWFSDTYKLDLMPLVPNIRVAPSLADSKWSTGLTIFKDGIWKSIYKVLSDSNGEFKLTDAEIIRILDDTLN